MSRFIKISLGSLAEVEYLISFAIKMDYLSENDVQPLKSLIDEVGRLLWSFQRSL